MLKLCREDWLLNKLLCEGKNASGIGHILKLEEEGVIIKEPKSRGKVLHIITGLGTGGAERMLVALLEATDRSRFQPEVVSLMGNYY